VQTYIVYLWRERRNVSITSTEEREHVEELKEWAAAKGYTVEITIMGSRTVGPEYQ
jgi:hypothetical protein